MKLNQLNSILPNAVISEDEIYLLHKLQTEPGAEEQFEDKKIEIGNLAEATPYDNTNSRLRANNVKSAIDELAAGGREVLNDLTDVTISSPTTKQVLQYNGSQWENSTFIEGTDNTVSGTNAHGEGRGVTASGNQAHAEGYYTQATYQNSHAEGSNTIADANDSHSEGFYTQASAIGAHAEGAGTFEEGSSTNKRTLASGFASHAEGQGTTASGDQSHAEGYHTIAGREQEDEEELTGEDAHAEGFFTKALGKGSHAEGCGYISESGTNDQRILASGEGSHAEGKTTIASGDGSHAEGFSSKASHTAAHAEGSATHAQSFASHTEGSGTIANGDSSHAEGVDSMTLGIGSHAGGYDTTAYGDYSFIHGQGFWGGSLNFKFILDLSNICSRDDDEKYYFDTDTTFDGVSYNIILSNPNTRITSYYLSGAISTSLYYYDQDEPHENIDSFVCTFFSTPTTFERSNNYTVSSIPVVPTSSTIIPAHSYINKSSCVLRGSSGYGGIDNGKAEAKGQISTALGGGLLANGDCQTVIGSFNIVDNNKAFIIGNGTFDMRGFSPSDNVVTRSNALTVDWDGNLETAGTIKALNIPDPPAIDGTYTLTCTVLNGVATYSWT